jgi:hypothetical protein
LKCALDELAVRRGGTLGGGDSEGVAKLIAVIEPGGGDEDSLPIIVPQRHGLVAGLWG